MSSHLCRGRVSEVRVKVGDTVSKGQVIAVLDIPMLQRNVDRKRVAVARAEALLSAADDRENDVLLRTLDVKQAQLDVR